MEQLKKNHLFKCKNCLNQKNIEAFFQCNIDIFTLLHEPHTSRLVQGFDSVNSGACSIGVIKGNTVNLMRFLTESATDDDQWRIVNLKGPINNIAAFDSIAVLGAVDDHASALAQMQFGRMFDAIEDDVIETNTNGLLRHLGNTTIS